MSLKAGGSFVVPNGRRTAGQLKRPTSIIKVIMKNQYALKQVSSLKDVVKNAAKHESSNIMKFIALSACCKYALINGQSKPVFSL